MKITLTDGQEYEVAHTFSPSRAIISYDGLYVLVDQVDGAWDLSGEPARPEEKPVLETLLAPMMDQSIVTITKVNPS
jgi:hypothetical protein